MEDLKQQYLDELQRLSNLEYRDEIKIAELKENFNGMSIEIRKKEKLLQEEQWAYLSTHPSKRLIIVIVMSADSAVTYSFVHSEAQSWSIPSEDPYEEAAQRFFEQTPHSLEYVPRDHVPVFVPEFEHLKLIEFIREV
nr:hypothetical protein [Tanacetum cinerariifolium]